MPETPKERRSRSRVPVRVPVAINSRDGSLQTTGYTRDLSERGIFLYCNGRMEAGAELEMVLILPSELTGDEKRWVCCKASVVRLEDKGEPGNLGMAASISSIQVLPEIGG